jgi:hypothetical protein
LNPCFRGGGPYDGLLREDGGPQIGHGLLFSLISPELLGDRRIFQNDDVPVRTAGGDQGACRTQHKEEGFHFGTDAVRIRVVSKRPKPGRKSTRQK